MYKLRTNGNHGCTEYTFMVKYKMKRKSNTSKKSEVKTTGVAALNRL